MELEAAWPDLGKNSGNLRVISPAIPQLMPMHIPIDQHKNGVASEMVLRVANLLVVYIPTRPFGVFWSVYLRVFLIA